MTNLVTMLPMARALWHWSATQMSSRRTERGTEAITTRAKKVGARALTLALGAAVLMPVAARAWNDDTNYRPASAWQTQVDAQLVDVSIQVDGESAPLYFSPKWADQRRYVEAFAGRNYSVVLRNNTGRRVGVLVAVDGLNVVNGERTRLSSGEAMYVLDPWERAEIKGWRTSLDNVRRFVFVDEQRSYAERTGQANSDMGWIRVLSFREQRTWWESKPRVRGDERPYGNFQDKRRGEPESTNEQPRADAGPSAPESKAVPQTAREMAGRSSDSVAPQAGGSYPGTGWGERNYDPVNQVQFRAERTPTDRVIVRYEYASGLRALGIEPEYGDRWERNRLRERDGGGTVGFARPPRR